MQFSLPGIAPINVPDEDWSRTPKSVQEAFKGLLDSMEGLVALVASLKQRVDELEGKSKKGGGGGGSDSKQRSLPNRGREAGSRQRGGQPGHPGNSRVPFSKDQVDETTVAVPKACQSCGRSLDDVESKLYLSHQVVELASKPYKVTEHTARSCECPDCETVNYGELPSDAVRSNFGPKLTAMLSFMSGVLHMSRRDIVEYVRSVLGISISLGTVSSLEGLTTDALAGAYAGVHEDIQKEEAAGADDTGWLRDNEYACLWVFTSSRFTYYQITPDKSAKSAALVLGGFGGTLTSDRAKNLDCFNGWRQTCWAHLDRHFLAISERPGASRQVGLDAMEIHDQVFQVWHQFKADVIDADQLFEALKGPREELENILDRGTRCGDSKTQNTCQNLLDIYERLWTFSYLDGVEPTNNSSERHLRPGVTWRNTSQGSRSDRGTRFAETMMTVAATCRQQGRSVLQFLEESITAFARKIPGPRLTPPDPAPT